MLKKLQIKFVSVIMTLTLFMMCAIFGMIYYFTRASLEADSIRMMKNIVSSPMRPDLPGEPSEDIRLPYFILQFEENGTVTVRGNSGYYDLSDREFLDELIRTAMNSGEQTGTIRAYHLRFCQAQTPQGPCLVFADISSEQNTLNHLLQNFIGIGVITAAAFFLISLLLARWAVNPVRQAWMQQRQFVADASHELKTPLTVILTNAELLQSSDCDEISRAQFSGSILTMAKQMRGLVESLLELARLDSQTENVSLLPLDLSALVSDALLPFEPLYYEHGIAMNCQIREHVTVKGNETRLRQVVDILLDNALKYTPSPAAVTVALQVQGNHCLLSVANPGGAIAPEDLKNIFKRFYRADEAHTRTGSYGLGLAIAEGIITAHRGKIWAESSHGINTFFVRLPVL